MAEKKTSDLLFEFIQDCSKEMEKTKDNPMLQLKTMVDVIDTYSLLIHEANGLKPEKREDFWSRMDRLKQ